MTLEDIIADDGPAAGLRYLAACALKYGDDSKSQLNQDLFVTLALGEKQNGFFVDLGAADGIALSNTYLLEKRFGWHGLLVEPAQCYPELTENRTSPVIRKCVWSRSGEQLRFCQSPFRELSSVASLASIDYFAKERTSSASRYYEVETITLNDLLSEAPAQIDYLSIDVEGSESEVLDAFDFSKHSFAVITCEHNHVQSARERIYTLLTSHNYRRVCESISDFEDWYLHKPVPLQEIGNTGNMECSRRTE